MKHLDGKPAWSGEVEGPGPVHVLGLSGLHSCRLQPVVDVIDLVVRILHEANVEPLGIGDLVRMVEIADGEHETSVIRQYDVSVRRFGDAAESEVLFKKITGFRYINDGKVDVIEFHSLSVVMLNLIALEARTRTGETVATAQGHAIICNALLFLAASLLTNGAARAFRLRLLDAPPVSTSRLDEFQEVFVDRLGVGGEHAMWKTGIELQGWILKKVDLEQGGAFVRNDLVVFPLHDERRHVDALEVLGEVGF